MGLKNNLQKYKFYAMLKTMTTKDIQEQKKLAKQKLLEIDKEVEEFVIEFLAKQATTEELEDAKKLVKRFKRHQDVVRDQYKKHCDKSVNPAVVMWLAWMALISEMLKTLEDTGFYE